jgi:hypothetical protein
MDTAPSCKPLSRCETGSKDQTFSVGLIDRSLSTTVGRIRRSAAQATEERQPSKHVAKSSEEVTQGAGLGEILTVEEGRGRLAAYATPTRVETWAGPMAGPTELGRNFSLVRSTLDAWQKQGAVIGLLVGTRKHAFPTEQLVDGRPVAGLGAVVEAIGDARIAWLWLREPNPGLAGAAPLTRLKAGAAAQVLEIARSNFGEA